MIAALQSRRAEIAEVCRRFGVRRLDVFGSAARARDFDAGRSDADFLVEFNTEADGLAGFLDLGDALRALLGQPVDLVDRRAVETSRNPIRRRAILDEAELIYAA